MGWMLGWWRFHNTNAVSIRRRWITCPNATVIGWITCPNATVIGWITYTNAN
jgi:hypothetical protein